MNPPDKPGLAGALRSLAEKLGKVANHLERSESRTEAPDGPDSLALSLAEAELENRSRRHTDFEGDMFTAPGWIILLCVFVSQSRGSPITTSMLARRARIAETTAWRWVCLFAKRGLVEAPQALPSRAEVYVHLTQGGMDTMRDHLLDGTRSLANLLELPNGPAERI